MFVCSLIRACSFLLLAVLLNACAATYHAAESGNSGYRDIQVKPGVYYVEYTESANRSWQVIHQFALKRCAEITKQQGYKYFDVISKDEKLVKLSSDVDHIIVPGALGGDVSRGQSQIPATYNLQGSKVEGRRVTYKIQLANE